VADDKKLILNCIDLFNKGTLEWVDTCYSRDLEWTEFPSPGFPAGRKGGFAEFREAAFMLLLYYPDRKLGVIKCLAEKDAVMLEQEWTGTLAKTLGEHKAGEIFRLRIASVFTLKDGLIIAQNDYPTRIS